MTGNSKAAHVWRRLAVLALAVVILGLPINSLLAYALLAVGAVVTFAGDVSSRRVLWLAAAGIVATAVLLRVMLAPSPIEEGHNAFLPEDKPGVLSTQLPPAVYRFMEEQFEKQYPRERRCVHTGEGGCWRGQHVDRLFAFAADGLFGNPRYSRSVFTIDFDNPIWHRLGFANDASYNWYSISDVQRAIRNRQSWKGYDRWQFVMPWFAMYQFPAEYVGSQLCWRGDVLWEGTNKSFELLRHDTRACRAVAAADIGKSIFAIGILPSTLAMKLVPSASIQARLLIIQVATVAAVVALLLLLVQVNWRRAAAPTVLIAIALGIVVVEDASVIGGFRPFDGGDDGLVYTGWGQLIAQYVAKGDILAALRGVEAVYYYGGPGLRYFRAMEMFAFGDSNFGYLSLLLLLPIAVFSLFRRFLPLKFAWPIALIFTATPLGEIFGTSFFHYSRWVARGFADPASQILLVCGVLVIIGPKGADHTRRAGAMLGGALLLALSVFVKPIIAPMVGVVLGALGVYALLHRHWLRLIAMCAGFSPFFLMPLHNWYFGKQFVLLSANACLPGTCSMPPAAYLTAFGELARGEFHGPYVQAAFIQVRDWLSGASGRHWTIPLNAVALAILVYMLARRKTDPWIRLLSAAALAEHATALIYLPTPRYFFAMWLVTGLVVAVFLAERPAVARWQPPRWLRTVTPRERSSLATS